MHESVDWTCRTDQAGRGLAVHRGQSIPCQSLGRRADEYCHFAAHHNSAMHHQGAFWHAQDWGSRP